MKTGCGADEGRMRWRRGRGRWSGRMCRRWRDGRRWWWIKVKEDGQVACEGGGNGVETMVVDEGILEKRGKGWDDGM